MTKTMRKPSKLEWYLHRLRAMGPTEIAHRLSRRLRRSRTESLICDSIGAECGPRYANAYPKIDHGKLPAEYHADIAQAVREISNGDWKLFGHVPVKLDMPPRWHHEPIANYTADNILPSSEIDHRRLPNGADGRVLWELSRWSEVTRLAQACSELGDAQAGELCVELLEDWVEHNPPLRGINWTSPLEGGIRLINFAWIDALLYDLIDDATAKRWEKLCRAILAPHVRWLWLERSLGSSANNHLLGELVGLVVILCRWPQLCDISTSIDSLRAEISRQVLLQFAPDGGNHEQALHYHWFAVELAWHADAALESCGEGLTTDAKERLALAASFFVDVAETKEPWDYGDSDDAHVVPLFANLETKIPEFHQWAAGQQNAVSHWWPKSPRRVTRKSGDLTESTSEPQWTHFEDTGFSCYRDSRWSLRFDHSPLGFAPMAAHGHLDALHLSIWYEGLAVIIDPGTGCYFHDAQVRNYLASWSAHNGPRFETQADDEMPQRFGPFLWGNRHADPILAKVDQCGGVGASLQRSIGTVQRTIERLDNGWRIVDGPLRQSNQLDQGMNSPVKLNWQISPDWGVHQASNGELTLSRENISIKMTVIRGTIFEEMHDSGGHPVADNFVGLCSRGFRSLCHSRCVSVRSDDCIETNFTINNLD